MCIGLFENIVKIGNKSRRKVSTIRNRLESYGLSNMFIDVFAKFRKHSKSL